MSKISNVLAGTIYIYFENKQDLINKLYLNTKQKISNKSFICYIKEQPIKDRFKKIYYNIAHLKSNVTPEVLFLTQCDDSRIID